MAIHYLDPEGGSDANNGSSFALRKRTPASLALTYGDEVRVMATPDPCNLGNGTWTDGSATVTLAAAKTLTIDNCETNWTPSTNVTAAAASRFKQGSRAQSLAIASGFTTGLVAYFPLGSTVDMSAYQAVSLQLYLSAGSIAASTLRFDLCSDAVGAVPVKSFNLPTFSSTAGWKSILLDGGAGNNLPSNVQSIAITALADPGTTTIFLDNIIACKTFTDSEHLSHRSLLTKGDANGNDPEPYSIKSISGTTIILGDSSEDNTNTTASTFRGTSETVTTYALAAAAPHWSTAERTLAAVSGTGSETNRITFTYGWDRTAMSSQTGRTIHNGEGEFSSVLVLTNVQYWTVGQDASNNNLGVVAYVTEPMTISTSRAGRMRLYCSVGMGTSRLGTYESMGGGVDVYCKHVIWGSTTSTLWAPSGGAAGAVNRYSSRLKIDTLVAPPYSQHGITAGSNICQPYNLDAQVGKIKGNANGNVGAAGGSAGTIRLRNTRFEKNTTDLYMAGVEIHLENPIFTATNPVITNPGSSDGIGSRCTMSRVNGNDSDHRVYTGLYTILTDTGTTRSGSGVSWKVTPLTATALHYDGPCRVLLGKFAVKSGSLVTLGCSLRRDSTNISIGLELLDGQVPGLTGVRYDSSVAANTWEDKTLTFTPTANGVVELWGLVWTRATSVNAFFDLISFSQA